MADVLIFARSWRIHQTPNELNPTDLKLEGKEKTERSETD